MLLAPGSRLGVYEIVSPLGVGGMGEVYRARDTKLHRDVALKILPPEFGHDPDRVARFKREAHVLASLNHPNIAAIHGFEDSTDPPALALELVDGPTLAERIAEGPMSLDDVLPIAGQLCDALEAAHEQGIVHRDLKPANIKIRSDGTVKVLDFGLAKALEPALPNHPDVMLSPTITSPALTELGLILGTASYMSPEQARGRPADKRSDIWAFGCVLFEMLTGKRPFEGEEISDTLASVLKTDPDWTLLPPTLSPPVRAVIEGCLKRDRRDRIADISTARFVLNQPRTLTLPLTSSPGVRGRAWKAAVLMFLGVAIGGTAAVAVWSRRPRPAAAVARFSFALPPGQQFTTLVRQIVTISPDGTTIAFAAAGRLYLRPIADLEPRAVPGGEQAIGLVFSPDSRWLAFYADRSIKRISVSGGAPITIYRVGSPPLSLTWDASGILFPVRGTGVMRISADGGKPEVLVPLNIEDGVPVNPQLLPDRETLLFTLAAGSGDAAPDADRWDAARIILQSLKTGQRETLIEPGADARYVPTGHIVYALGTTLFARPFDLATRRLTGGAIPVIDGVQRMISETAAAQLAFSAGGSLVYLHGPRTAGLQQLVAFDRKAGGEALRLAPGAYRYPRVSPDGKRVAFESNDGKEAFISVFALSGTNSATRLTFGSNNRFPIWTRDGTRIVFQSDRAGDPGLFWQPIDGGGAEPLTKPDPGTSHVPEAWSPAEDVLLFNVTGKSEASLWTMAIRDRIPVRFDDVKSSIIPTTAVFSPDGHWVAYQVGETGSGEGSVFVQPYPANGRKYQIAQPGGRPLWSRDGKELFYLPAPGQLAVVGVTTQPTFTLTDPVVVPRGFGVSGPLTPRAFDMMADGRILGLSVPPPSPGAANDALQIHVVINWFEELKARAQSK